MDNEYVVNLIVEGCKPSKLIGNACNGRTQP